MHNYIILPTNLLFITDTKLKRSHALDTLQTVLACSRLSFRFKP